MEYLRVSNESLKDITYYLSGNRLTHSLSVVKEMDIRINYLYEVYRYYLEKAAEYHDIGYSEKIPKKTGNHSIDGYLYIKDKTHPLTAYLILRHTGAKDYVEGSKLDSFYKEIELLALKEVEDSGNVNLEKVEGMVDLLTKCDILIGSEGNKVSSKERLKSVLDRYGEESKEYIILLQEIKRLNI